MHGLINRAVQCFVRDTYGPDLWLRVAREAGLPFDSFEPMLRYDVALTDGVIAAAARILSRPREALLEDLGHYLVSHQNLESLRRLLRFGGVSFGDFLNSLEDLPGRGRLAVPDLDLPDLVLQDRGGQIYALSCRFPMPGVGHVMLGLLRAMADDYGALVLLDHDGKVAGVEVISIHLADTSHTAGRRFDLAAPVG